MLQDLLVLVPVVAVAVMIVFAIGVAVGVLVGRVMVRESDGGRAMPAPSRTSSRDR